MSDTQPRLFGGTPARHTDPETSHDAAASLREERVRRSQQHVLTLLRREGPLTDSAISELYPRYYPNPTDRQSPSGLRTRRAELVDQGLVEDSGERATLPSGRKSIVWRVTR